MDPELPLTRLVLRAGSVAQDLTFVALADATTLFFDGSHPRSLLIGGQMVTLHAYRWGLGAELYRESLDTDMGVPLVALQDPDLVPRIEGLGYRRTSGNTFARVVDDLPPDLPVGAERAAVIELLAPAFTSRVRSNVRIGDLAVTEVPGLAIAMQRSSTVVELLLTRLNEQVLDAKAHLPDEVSCLLLRAHAWRVRGDDRDAIDVWRALEIAYRANVGTDQFAGGPLGDAAALLRASFGTEDAPGTRAALSGRSLVPSAPLGPRIVALVREVLGTPI
jgi:hypothetical protein